MSNPSSSVAARPNGGTQSDVLRLPQVVQRTGLGRSTIYRLMACRRFPLPVRLADRAVGWRQSDLDAWSAALQTVAH